MGHKSLTLSSARHKPHHDSPDENRLKATTLNQANPIIKVSLCLSCIHCDEPWAFCECFDPKEEVRRGFNLVIRCRGHQLAVTP